MGKCTHFQQLAANIDVVNYLHYTSQPSCLPHFRVKNMARRSSAKKQTLKSPEKTKSAPVAFFHGFLSGMTSPSYLYTFREYSVKRSDTDSMRSDWLKIGNDFRKVMSKYGETADQAT